MAPGNVNMVAYGKIMTHLSVPMMSKPYTTTQHFIASFYWSYKYCVLSITFLNSLTFRVVMAEAHSAVAFSFAVSHEGLHINVNHDALWAVWESGVRSWKKQFGRIKVRANLFLHFSDKYFSIYFCNCYYLVSASQI